MQGTLIPTSLATVQNRVLACMEPASFERLRPHLQRVALKHRAILQERNRPIEHVYSSSEVWRPCSHGRSGTVPLKSPPSADWALWASQRCWGAARSPNRGLMEVPGEALRIASPVLRQAMADMPAVSRQLLHYVHALIFQNTQTALCNARHELQERLGRWLLLAADRLDERVIRSPTIPCR